MFGPLDFELSRFHCTSFSGLCGIYNKPDYPHSELEAQANDLTAENGQVYDIEDVPVEKAYDTQEYKPRPDDFSKSYR